MPYVSLQHQGLIMSDSGLHERWIVWTGLATSLRELPLRVLQLYILTEYLPFWTLSDIGEGTLGHCTGIHVNETTLLQVIAFGLFVSALALSDQLEREMPYGAFPRRFSRALSAPLCESPAILWNIIFILMFFVDLFIRFFVLVPLASTEGLSPVMLVFFVLLCTTSTIVWLTLTLQTTKKESSSFVEKDSPAAILRKRSGIDSVSEEISTTAAAAEAASSTSQISSPRTNTPHKHILRQASSELSVIMSAELEPAIENSSPFKHRRRRQSSLKRMTSWSATNKRSGSDSYDSGMRLQAFEVIPTPCGCCMERRPKWISAVVESMPFVLWGLWVDLPLRMKWLRLAEDRYRAADKTDVSRQSMQDLHESTLLPVRCCCCCCRWTFHIQPSLGFYALSSLTSMIILSALFVWNIYNLEATWSQGMGTVECTKIIPTGCRLSHNVTCPSNFTASYDNMMQASATFKYAAASIIKDCSSTSSCNSGLNMSNVSAVSSWSWTKGCRPLESNNVDEFCVPEIWSGITGARTISVEAVR